MRNLRVPAQCQRTLSMTATADSPPGRVSLWLIQRISPAAIREEAAARRSRQHHLQKHRTAFCGGRNRPRCRGPMPHEVVPMEILSRRDRRTAFG